MMNSKIKKKKNSVSEKEPNFSSPKNLENIYEAKSLSNIIDLDDQLSIQINKEPIEINHNKPLPFSKNGFHPISSGIPNYGDGAFKSNISLAIINENPENSDKTKDCMLMSNGEKANKEHPYINQDQAELNCSIIVQFILKESFANYSMLNQSICLNISNGIASDNEVIFNK